MTLHNGNGNGSGGAGAGDDSRTVPLSWRPTPHAHRLLVVGGLTLSGGVVLGRPVFAAVAAPFLVLLAWGLTVRRPATATITVTDLPRQCIEGEPIELGLKVDTDIPVEHVAFEIPLPEEAGFQTRERRAAEESAEPAGDGDDELEHAHIAPLIAGRWGRWTVGPAVARLTTGWGALGATVALPLGQIAIYPRASAEDAILNVGRLPNRGGDHASRALGEGVEFAGISEYVAGQSLRRVNWSVTSRRGQLHMNRFAAERALDLVLAIDAFSEVGERGRSSLDVSLRGVVGLAQAYLRRHDRVGVVAIGGMLRWLGPDVGTRQLYRVAEQLLAVRLDASFVDPDLERIPRSALPPGALVVLFTPLLDPRTAEAARELRERGHPIVLVDVLTVEPMPARRSRLGEPALRLWRLDRRAQRRELAQAGIPVVTWDGATSLDAALAPLVRVPLAARSS